MDGKRRKCLKMLNDQKIKQPQTATLEYYNIEKDGDKYVLLQCFHKILYKTILCQLLALSSKVRV